MGVTKDFIKATIADAMTPTFRRPMEDLIYETLDRRQIPTRTDFKELRDLVNNLRGQVSGSIQSVRTLHSKLEDLEDQIEDSESSNDEIASLVSPLEERLNQLESTIQNLNEQTIVTRMIQLEEKITQQEAILQRLQALEERQQAIEISFSSSTKTCIVDGCTADVRSRGFCTSHYKKFRRGTLPGFINKDGILKIGKKKYMLPMEYEAQPFSVEDTFVVVEDTQFLISELQEATKDS